MRPAPALTTHDGLFGLMRVLEKGPAVPAAPTLDLAGGILRPLVDDPGRQMAILVAEAGPSREVGRRWYRLHHEHLGTLLRALKARRATVVFPGRAPERPLRETLNGAEIRLVSAVDWLWVDKLRTFDSDGNRDDAKREQFLRRLGAEWTSEDEDRYTPASISCVSGAEAELAAELLTGQRPDLVPGIVSVLYGPGGIGKTYFLRRTADAMTRAAVLDPQLGIPVFAELPVLLTADALEAWLSHRGLSLPIEHISALIEHGVLVPLLDALDELVRGQAREGSKQFLAHLADLASPSGRALLSSRDYFLNFDPLVRDGLPAELRAELEVGYFPREGRRRYLEIRAGLSAVAAARWAARLEEEAGSALGEGGREVDALIGHPLFLEAFCEMLRELTPADQANAVDTFRITSPDVFGQILEVILKREESKARPGWAAKFGDRLVGTWSNPLAPDLQRKVFRALVEAVAHDGSVEVYGREVDQPALRDYRHAAFTFTRGLPETDGADSRKVLQEFLRRVLGEPELSDDVSAVDRDATIAEALSELAATYLQHTVADTRPPVVPELVYALRNRAYFDYLLAEALLDQMKRALASGDHERHEELLIWCLDHHIFERRALDAAEPVNSGCLDFVLWHRQAAEHALVLIDELFFGNGRPSGDVAGYVISLALAVMLRAALQSGRPAEVDDRSFGIAEGDELAIAADVVPLVSHLSVRRCTFPATRLVGIRLNEVSISDSDASTLALDDVSITDSRWDGIDVERLEVRGMVRFTGCRLSVSVGGHGVAFDPSADLTLTDCALSESLSVALEDLARTRPDAVKMTGCEILQSHEPEHATKGRQFVDKLVVLARKHGHDEYGLYGPKLRGLSVARPETFGAALEVLRKHGVVSGDGEMLYLTQRGAELRYSIRGQPGMRSFDDVADAWAPVVADLDAVL